MALIPPPLPPPPRMPPPPAAPGPPPGPVPRLWKTGHPLPLHPLSFGEVFDTVIHLVRLHWRPLAVTAAIVTVPSAVVAGSLIWATADPRLRTLEVAALSADPDLVLDVMRDLLVPLLLFTLPTWLLVTPVLVGATARLTARAFVGDRPRTLDALAAVLRSLGRLLPAMLLVGLVVTLGYAALLVPGLVLYVRLLFVPAIATVEGAGAIEAPRRSWVLTRGRGWPIFGTVLLANLAAGFIGGAIITPLSVLFTARGDLLPQLVMQAAGSMLLTPIATIFAVVLYIDARVRYEELDHDRLAAEGRLNA